MIELLINVVAPVFISIAIGYGWVKIGRAYDTSLITSLVMSIGAPCLVFSALTSLTIPINTTLKMAAAAVVVVLATGVIGWVVLGMIGLPKRAFMSPIMFANIGNMGLPLCLFAFGKPGLALAVVGVAVYSVLMLTVGAWLYSGETNLSALLKIPIVYAVLLSLVVMATGWQVPLWIARTSKLLADFTIPLVLITLGVSLAKIRVEKIKRALIVSVLRLAIGFLVGLLVAWMFKLPWPARGVIILQSTMPAAVFNYLLAQNYNRYANDTAGVVVISTVLSLVTLPFLLQFLAQ